MFRVDAWPWGGEPIYRNGQYVGVTTTTGFGYTLNNLVSLNATYMPTAMLEQ